MALQVRPLSTPSSLLNVASLQKQPSLNVVQPQQQKITSIGTATQQRPYTAKKSMIEFARDIKKQFPQYANADDMQLARDVLAKYPEYAEKVDVPQEPAVKQPGLGQKIAQGVASPFLRTASTVAGVAGGIKNLFDIGVAKIRGDEEAVQKNLAEGYNAMRSEPRDFGYLGQVKPIENPIQGAGVGAELGSYAIGGGGAKSVFQAGIKGLIKQGTVQGIKSGLAGGAVGGFGIGLQQDDPSVKGVLGSTAAGALGGGLLGGLFGGATAGTLGAGRNVITKLTGNFGKQADEAIEFGIGKGVKPTVVGKKTPAQVEKFMNNAKTGVKYLVENQDQFNLLDDTGTKLKLPKTAAQTSEFITQAKRQVFGRYNYLKNQAGEGGAKVYLSNVADELDNVADGLSKYGLVDLAEPIRFAKTQANILRQKGFYTPDEAQEAVKALNQVLEPFYKKGVFDSPNTMFIRQQIVNKLRQELAKTIDNATGQSYQPLKNIYGALEALETEVNHRAIIQGRQATKSLIDFFDVLSAGDIVNGVLSGSPIQVVKGFTQKGVSSFYKHLINPDRVIGNMFKNVDKIYQRANKKGVSLLPKTPMKLMKALPPPSVGTQLGRVPSVNLSPIYQPTRIRPLETGGAGIRSKFGQP